MKNIIEAKISPRQCGKTLKQWKDFIEHIESRKCNDYVLYIDKDFYNKYKDVICLADVEIEITTVLPKRVNAAYMKKTDWEKIDWYE